MFKGSICALITPFHNGAVDRDAFANLIERQIENGTHGLVPCGTTGESPTLSHEEHNQLVELCVMRAAGRVPVMAGTGSNSTEEAIALTRHAQKAGADAALVVAPYYNKPNQEGLYRHFKAIHDATDIPIYVYNIPARCVIEVSVATMARLAELPRVAGVKDATANLLRVAEEREAIGPNYVQLSGEDATVLSYMAEGGQGCISVTANVAPALCAEFQNTCLTGDFTAARELHRRLLPLHRALFLDPNPVPSKYALAKLGLCTDEVRLPLVPAVESTRDRVDAALEGLGMLG